jgi:hypothetical protein
MKTATDPGWARIRAHNEAEQKGLTADGWVFPTLEARARHIARVERYWALRGIAYVPR